MEDGFFVRMRTPCTSRLERRTIVQIDTLRGNDIPGRTRISHDVLECPHAQETKHPVPPRLTPWYVVRRPIAVLVLFTVIYERGDLRLGLIEGTLSTNKILPVVMHLGWKESYRFYTTMFTDVKHGKEGRARTRLRHGCGSRVVCVQDRVRRMRTAEPRSSISPSQSLPQSRQPESGP